MEEGTETGLPASIEEAWGVRRRPRKGPKPGLDLERIVAAAVKVAASEGIAAVSMSRIATELGSSAMSLYRYVAAKDELLALMVDSAFDAPMAPASPDEEWRAGMARWAWTYHDALRRHPWVLRIPISGPPVTPNQTAWMEDGLRTLGGTGLAEGEKLSVILLVSGYVRNEAMLSADLAAAAARTADGQIMPTWSQQLARLTDADRFPALHAALASGVFDEDDDPDDEFSFGLERVLDGIEALVRRRGAAG
jgi:AcrR family transcriptional regulator